MSTHLGGKIEGLAYTHDQRTKRLSAREKEKDWADQIHC